MKLLIRVRFLTNPIVSCHKDGADMKASKSKDTHTCWNLFVFIPTSRPLLYQSEQHWNHLSWNLFVEQRKNILLLWAEIHLLTLCETFSCLLSSQTQAWNVCFGYSFFHLLQSIISPRLASKHGKADRCVASFMDKIPSARSVCSCTFFF